MARIYPSVSAPFLDQRATQDARGEAREGEVGEASSGRRFLVGRAKVFLLADALSHSPTLSLDVASGPTSISFVLDAEYV
ncbi:hypothetical protein B296_00034921 [Ensete ventricosum]|uniref:Uncharacterized protein n=1 Tax=Ensete ventricosum TaxID=4639 RepID=A0A427A0Q7_ENSVE|nr:hypothetical protein B296_00034921 [Ensete ventricosum]